MVLFKILGNDGQSVDPEQTRSSIVRVYTFCSGSSDQVGRVNMLDIDDGLRRLVE